MSALPKAVTFCAVLAVFVFALAGCKNDASADLDKPPVTVNKSTVTFNKNNDDPGSTEANPKTKGVSGEGATIGSLPTPPTRPGYTFTGWMTETEGGSIFTGNTPVWGDMTVYAQWEINRYSVIFDSNGAADGTAPAAITAEYNTPIIIPDDPGLSKPGYSFDGWNTRKDGGGTKYSAGESYTVTGDARLYAYWEAMPHDSLSELLAEVFDQLHIEQPVFGRMYAHGSTHDVVPVRGSVIHYMFDDLIIDKTKMIDVGGSRPGTVRSNTKYIIYHDTANTNATANALTHANLQYNGFDNASWHYTVDDREIYQSIPDNEVAWHAGNSEGNNNSIGIETCVNWGTSQVVYMTDFFQIWQRMGKLVASLLDEYNLTMDNVLSHKEITVIGTELGLATSHKCCPATLRHATLYNMAKNLIRCEFLYLQKIQKAGYTAEIIIDPASSEYINAGGRVIKLPPVPTTVYYTIKLTAPDGQTREKIYSSLLPSQSVDYIGGCDITSATCTFNSFTSIPAVSIIMARVFGSVPSWRSFSAGHTHDDTICDITWGNN